MLTIRYSSAALALLLVTPFVLADSTSNYRAAFVKHCTSGDNDPLAARLCDCSFTQWENGLSSKTSPQAINAAKLMTNSATELYPSEMAAAVQLLGDFSNDSMACADQVYGKIAVGGHNDSGVDTADDTLPDDWGRVIDAAQTDMPTESETPPETATKKRGLFGAVTGWAGRKAGLGDEISDLAADKVDENESTISSKLNPFKRNKDDADNE